MDRLDLPKTDIYLYRIYIYIYTHIYIHIYLSAQHIYLLSIPFSQLCPDNIHPHPYRVQLARCSIITLRTSVIIYTCTCTCT